MLDFATTTISAAMRSAIPLMFALQPGASSVGVVRVAAEQPQLDRRAVPLFEPKESSFENFQIAVPNPRAIFYSSAWVEGALEKIESSFANLQIAIPRPSTISQSSDWVEGALERIESYAGLPDGWRGEGSRAPTQLTLQETAELLLQISAEMPDLPRPLISVDEEGFACLHWNSSSLLTTISAYGDGTYSFFSEGYGVVARSDNELVGAILPQRLIESMTGQYALEATLAA